MNLVKLILPALILILSASGAFAQTAFGPVIENEAYTISREIVYREIALGDIFRDYIRVTNHRDSPLSVSVSVSSEIDEVIDYDISGLIVPPGASEDYFFTILGREIGDYEGEITLSGGVSQRIPVTIKVVEKKKENGFTMNMNLMKKKIAPSSDIDFLLRIEKHNPDQAGEITVTYALYNLGGNDTILLGEEIKNLTGTTQINKEFAFPSNLSEGFYVVEAVATFANQTVVSKSELEMAIPIYQKKLFGTVPVWLLASIILAAGLGAFSFITIKHAVEKRRKYKMSLDLKTLPKKSDKTLYLGKIAEKNIDTFLEIDRLTTHAVVAGATGGGKSISAQVIVEEALKKNVAVVVFDPTAQWSGMLRKCDDKRMLSLYPKFGLKPTDAKAFPGNVRMIKNSRQAIDIKKYMNPGQIQILALNKLDPSEMDTFVSSVIVSIFRSSPEEYPGLRVLLVFDEVHRLLPKFGGSGKGFLQIERACREFRKWGFGVMLVSQVLSDFVGEIKANINTEVQMRTRDESDLNRIKTKYGEDFLQSLIKASVGAGMFVNPAYNRGSPYFVQFRPILHNTRRLSDDVLEKYNGYGETIEDLEYQIEQLEAEKVDTFDLKMELKLVKDKLMSGNFTVVDIYLEGLLPRFEKQWQTLGKKPKKKQLELIEDKEFEASLAAAQKEREKWQEKAAKENGASGTSAAAAPATNNIEKIVRALNFDNGASASSLKELKELLPGLEDEIFAGAVNDKKHDIADWINKEVSGALAERVRKLKAKADIVKEIDAFAKAKPTEADVPGGSGTGSGKASIAKGGASGKASGKANAKKEKAAAKSKAKAKPAVKKKKK